MAEPYLRLLKQIVDGLGQLQIDDLKLESKHFFSGAALFANGKIFASLSPSGFAIKLPADLRKKLIESGKGTDFRFFANGPIKREYVALSDLTIADKKALRELIIFSIDYVLGLRKLKTR